MNTLEALRLLTPELAARYNSAELQRARILERLQRSPATRCVLERDCFAPSVTKRISELRRMGWRVQSDPLHQVTPDGRVNVGIVYSLTDANSTQCDLFETP